ncbi:MAG: peptidoglycan DD-metalloendopeptidase family protein [Chloroflexota bacterium]
MLQTRIYNAARVCLWLLVVFGLVGIPYISSGQEQTNSDSPSINNHVEEADVANAFTIALGQMADPALQITQLEHLDEWAYAVFEKKHSVGEGTVYDHHHAFMLLGRYDADRGWNVLNPVIVQPSVYNEKLEQFPEELLDENTKLFFMQPIQERGVRNFNGHKFPWKEDDKAHLIRKNGGEGHYNQVDFDIHGGAAIGDVYASKPGKVIFVKDSSNQGGCDSSYWSKANMIIIEHGPNEYSWYVHLAYKSATVSVNQQVDYGTRLGQEGATGWSCSNNGTPQHLHYMVSSGHGTLTDSTNPNLAPWTNTQGSVDFVESTWSELSAGVYTSENSSDTVDPNEPPHTPSLIRPSNDHNEPNQMPELCWKNNGDPNNDRVEFKVEINGEDSIDSGWLDQTCWHSSSLNDKFGDYTWKVKAIDSDGAESGWSETRTFTIKDANPPEITFSASNGNTSSSILENETDWTFTGTATDAEGNLDRVEFRCNASSGSGNTCGTGGSTASRSGNNWTYTRSGMTGKVTVYFVAYDDEGNVDPSRKVTLNIDRAAPTTTRTLNNESSSRLWPEWFTQPVAVSLLATDGKTGSVGADVKEVRYQIIEDGEPKGWKTSQGRQADFTESEDGRYTVDYYAIDNVGNQENQRSVSFQIDRRPPTLPTSVQESNGVVSGQWQGDHNTPAFTWNAASDNLSGLALYQLTFGTNANSTNPQKTMLAGESLTWTPQANGVRTGTHYLRMRTRDRAGNYSNWTTLFTYRYDGTRPENPEEATHAAGIKSDTWQRVTTAPNFTWPVPHDEGAGIKGYYTYWGNDPDGTTSNFTANPTLQSGDALCAANTVCRGYLRIRSVDQVDNEAEQWSTVFAMRYDDVPPTLALSINSGMTQTAQTEVMLTLTADDAASGTAGSGVHAMRFSNDGRNWTDWEAFAPQRLWVIPAISRQTWPVYAQVRDGVGLESDVVVKDIYLDVNRQQSRSSNYRLLAGMQPAGGGAHTSRSYQGHSTVGQVMDTGQNANGGTGVTRSSNYRLHGGYEAASQALPLVVPGRDDFLHVNGLFSSGTIGTGTVASIAASTSYQMVGVMGEPGLPNNVTTLQSGSYHLQPGFLASYAPQLDDGVDMPENPPGPPPVDPPAPACEFPEVSINNAATFTNDATVSIRLCAPSAVEMMVSNDGGFDGVEWEAYSESSTLTLTTHGQHVVPRYVYVAFKDDDGTVHGVYMDDIIYDPIAPTGNSLTIGDSLPPEAVREVAAKLMATGGAEGTEGQVQAAGTSSSQATYTRIGDVTYRLSDSQVLPVVSVPVMSGLVMSGPVSMRSRLTDTDTLTTAVEVFLSVQDDNSGVNALQLSERDDFGDANWQDYSALVPWTPSTGDGTKTLYARFRDSAGNVSEVINTSYIQDSSSPTATVTTAQWAIGLDTPTLTLLMEAGDNLSGVADMRISTDSTFDETDPHSYWQPYAAEIAWPVYPAEMVDADQYYGNFYVQFRDMAGNTSAIHKVDYVLDTLSPHLYAEATIGTGTGTGLTRGIDIYAFDEHSAVETMYVSNDPLMLDGVVEMVFTGAQLQWTFDEERVAWIQVRDSVGNLTKPYPVYAADTTDPVFDDGDVNGDGSVNIFDLQVLINMILHDTPDDTPLYPAEQWARAELNGDGAWNIFDLQMLINLITQ